MSSTLKLAGQGHRAVGLHNLRPLGSRCRQAAAQTAAAQLAQPDKAPFQAANEYGKPSTPRRRTRRGPQSAEPKETKRGHSRARGEKPRQSHALEAHPSGAQTGGDRDEPTSQPSEAQVFPARRALHDPHKLDATRRLACESK